MNIFTAAPVGDDWEEIRAELARAFEMSRLWAQAEESFVYIVRLDDLLGRGGAGDAMVAAGLLSAARTAAIEGSRRGWTVNVVAHDADIDPSNVIGWAERLVADSAGVTGELIRIGPSHLGKALP